MLRKIGRLQDYGKARKLYERAAEDGCDRESFLLGNLYEHGVGVPESLLGAHLYEHASDSGNVDSSVRLGSMVLEGQGVVLDLSRTVELFACAGDAHGAGRVGAVFSYGRGI